MCLHILKALRRSGLQRCSRVCRYDFQARQKEVAALEALQQADLAAWYTSSIAPGGVRRRKLCIHIAGEHALHFMAFMLETLDQICTCCVYCACIRVCFANCVGCQGVAIKLVFNHAMGFKLNASAFAGRTHAQDLTAPPADASASVVEDLAAWKAGGLPLYPAADGALPPGIKRAADQG